MTKRIVRFIGADKWRNLYLPKDLILGREYEVIEIMDRGQYYSLKGIKGAYKACWFVDVNIEPQDNRPDVFFAIADKLPVVGQSYELQRLEPKGENWQWIKTLTTKVMLANEFAKNTYRVETMNNIYIVQLVFA